MDQFDDEFNEYLEKIESRMWRGLAITIIVIITVLLTAAICYS